MNMQENANFIQILEELGWTGEQINKFIAELSEMDKFERVDYTGYTAISDKNGNSGWRINVVCTLAARATETTKSGEEG